MIEVNYKVVQDEKDQVIDAFTKVFQTPEERQQYEDSQMRHPFLSLKAVKVTITEGDGNV